MTEVGGVIFQPVKESAEAMKDAEKGWKNIAALFGWKSPNKSALCKSKNVVVGLLRAK